MASPKRPKKRIYRINPKDTSVPYDSVPDHMRDLWSPHRTPQELKATKPRWA